MDSNIRSCLLLRWCLDKMCLGIAGSFLSDFPWSNYCSDFSDIHIEPTTVFGSYLVRAERIGHSMFIGSFRRPAWHCNWISLTPIIVKSHASDQRSNCSEQNPTNRLSSLWRAGGEDSTFYETTTHDLPMLFLGTTIVDTLVFALVVLFFVDKPLNPPSLSQLSSLALLAAKANANYCNSLKRLFSNKNFTLLLIAYGLNVGVFYTVSTLLNQVLIKHYCGQELNIGRIGLVIILAGMAGSLVFGFWLDRTKMFRTTIIFVYLLSFVGMLLYTFLLDIGHISVVFVIAGFLGFFMTSYILLGFEFAIELTHPIPEGTSAGLLNCSAQLFGIIMITIMSELSLRVSDLSCNITLSVCLVVGTVITILIKADLRRQMTENKK